MNDKKIRIMLVDDHVVLRMGLATAANCEPDMEVVGQAENGEDAIAECRRCNPDVIVLDMRMPKQGGIETIKQIKEEFDKVRILVFSNYASGEEAMGAYRAGAAGFVVKDMPLDHLIQGIREVYKGEQYVPTEIANRLSRQVLTHLTKRELEVLTHVAQGRSNKEIAKELELVEGTIKVHLTNILSKLGVSDRTQAILAAVKRGLIHLD